MSQPANTYLALWSQLNERLNERYAVSRERGAERGATMAEYGLLLILVGIAAFAVIALVGGEIWELFRDTGDATEARQVPPPPD